jgi:hypothetical protein
MSGGTGGGGVGPGGGGKGGAKPGTGGAAGGGDSGHGARFVAVGYGARRLSSVDGKTWTEAPLVTNPPWSPGTSVHPQDGDNEWLLRGVCYGAGTWLAVGGNGSKGLTLLSQDGANWKVLDTQMSNDDCAYGLGLFVTGRRTSSDGGMTWQDAPAPPKSVRQIIFADGKFVAAGDQSGGNVSYSRDGKNWTNLPIAYATNSDSDRRGYYYLAYADGRFYAMKSCCNRSDYKLFTWDGVSDSSFTETPLADIVGTEMPESLTYVNGHLIMPGPGYYFDKPDGSATWTKHTTPTIKGANNASIDRPLTFVQYGNGLYVSPTAWSPNLADFTAAVLSNDLWSGMSVPGLFRMVARP